MRERARRALLAATRGSMCERVLASVSKAQRPAAHQSLHQVQRKSGLVPAKSHPPNPKMSGRGGKQLFGFQQRRGLRA